jgi:membrane protein DedA with SNARE-associated domain
LQYEQLIQTLSVWSYLAVFLAVFIESLGLPVPALTLALVMGALSGQGQLHFGLVWLATVAGGATGGLGGYWLGMKGGRRFIQKYGRYFLINESRFRKAEEIFNKHGLKAIVAGRYLPLICFFGGNIAGMAKMKVRLFGLANLAGIALWSTTQLSLAFVGGRSFDMLIKTVNGMILAVIAAIVIAGVVAYKLRRRQPQIIPVKLEEDQIAR